MSNSDLLSAETHAIFSSEVLESFTVQDPLIQSMVDEVDPVLRRVDAFTTEVVNAILAERGGSIQSSGFFEVVEHGFPKNGYSGTDFDKAKRAWSGAFQLGRDVTVTRNGKPFGFYTE